VVAEGLEAAGEFVGFDDLLALVEEGFSEVLVRFLTGEQAWSALGKSIWVPVTL